MSGNTTAEPIARLTTPIAKASETTTPRIERGVRTQGEHDGELSSTLKCGHQHGVRDAEYGDREDDSQGDPVGPISKRNILDDDGMEFRPRSDRDGTIEFTDGSCQLLGRRVGSFLDLR